MTRMFVSMALTFAVATSMAFAQDADKKKERPKKPKKTFEEVFKAKDANNDGKLSFDEFKGKATKPEILEKIEKRFKRLDRDGDKALTIEEAKAKPQKKAGPKKGAKKPAAKKPAEKKPCEKKPVEKKPCDKKPAEKK